jgi:protein involved in polysaccharide export with SLBB domain
MASSISPESTKSTAPGRFPFHSRDIRATGLTTKQLERSIASTLAKGIVRDPRVNVEIALYRPYYILGEVKKGGEYPYRLGLTVMDAVASAGGFTYHILPGYDRAVRPFQNGLPN